MRMLTDASRRRAAVSSWRASLWVLAFVALGACSEELEGPKPAVQDPAQAQPLPVDPGIVCRMQHPVDGTPIVITGENLSPLPYDIPDDPKTALPEINLVRSRELNGDAAGTVDVVMYGGEPDQANAELVSWQSQNQMTFRVKDEVVLNPDDLSAGMLPIGLYDVRLTNPNTHEATSAGALAVVDRPRVDDVTPGIVCLEQGERTVTLAGQTVLSVNGTDAFVEIAGERFDVQALSDCTPIAHGGMDARYCGTVTLLLAQDSVEVGFPEVTFQNPATAACGSVHAEDQVNLRVVPAPVIDHLQPPMVCVAEGPRDVIVVGTGFLEIDGELPAVSLDGAAVTVSAIGGTCETLETLNHTVRSCTEVTISVPESIDTGNGEVVPLVELTNPEPAGCMGSTSTGLVIVPPPTITSVVPPLICVDDGSRQVEINGTWFLFVDSVPPAVEFDGTAVVASAVAEGAGCVDLAVDNLGVRRCDSLLVTVDSSSVAIGLPVIRVTNPDPAGCSADAADLLTVIEGPEVTSAEPPLVCTAEGDRQIVLTGTGFLEVGGTLPTVTMDGTGVTVDSIADCQAVTVAGLTNVQQCTTLNVTAPQGSLAEGDTVVVVTNPQPAGCEATSTTALTVPPAVTLTAAAPASVCTSSLGAVDVTFTGTGFLRVGTTDFTVSVAGTPTVPSAITGCAALDVDGLTVESCTGFTVSIDTTGMTAGGVEVSVANPDPSGCGTSASTVFQIVEPPTVTSVAPNHLCADDPTTSITVIGEDFASSATVALELEDGTTLLASAVTFVSETELTATFASGIPANTFGAAHGVTVDNGDGCATTLPDAITVDPTPLVFFVDPPVVFNGISTEVTIFTTGLSAVSGAGTIELVNTTTNASTPLTFSVGSRPNRLLATIPEDDPANTGNPLPPGDYEVTVTSTLGCESIINGRVTIVSDLSIALQSIEPAFVSKNNPTAVTITATAGSPAKFVSTPRAYLNPTSAGTATATPLRAVVFESDTVLTAIVPPLGDAGVGQYDLIVVNPTGEVGLLTGAVTVTDNEPPIVESAAPSSVVSNTTTNVTLRGSGFDTAGITIDVTCVGWDPAATGVRTVTTTATPTVGTEVTFPLNASGLAAGDVCAITVTNTDGAITTFSAISVKNSGENLNGWVAVASGRVADMLEPRRGLGLATGRPTSTSRFLFAIGGDDGTDAAVKTSVEGNSVDTFGAMGTLWTYQRYQLDAVAQAGALVSMPRAFGGIAKVGRYLYLVGGRDGTTAHATTLRAAILDPLDGPEVADLDAQLGDPTAGTGLGEGLWFYRLSATFPSTDGKNPLGESLPGEILPVQLPQVTEGIVLTLKWNEVPGANGYRLYRAVPDATTGGVGPFELLAAADCGDQACTCVPQSQTPGVGELHCAFVDDATGTPDTAQTPLPQGSLGRWHEVAGADLSTAREAHRTVAFQHPTDPTQWLLYAIGGRDAGGAYLDSYEYALVTIGGDGAQTVGAWTVGGSNLLGPARAELGAWVLTGEDSPAIASTDANADGLPDVWLYIGPGRTATGIDGTVEAGLVNFDSSGGVPVGELALFPDAFTGDSAGSFAGYTSGDAGGYLYLFGGGTSGNSAQVCPAVSGGCTAPPDLVNGAWNSLGGGVPTQRTFAGLAQESAFFFLAGGTTAGGVTNSVETTVQ